jgi:hypothetical protein
MVERSPLTDDPDALRLIMVHLPPTVLRLSRRVSRAWAAAADARCLWQCYQINTISRKVGVGEDDSTRSQSNAEEAFFKLDRDVEWRDQIPMLVQCTANTSLVSLDVSNTELEDLTFLTVSMVLVCKSGKHILSLFYLDSGKERGVNIHNFRLYLHS